MIQRATLQVLNPIIDPTFSPYSYGYRPQRNAQQAIKQAQQYVHDGYRYVVSIDLENCFDTINHLILSEQIKCKVDDPLVLSLINSYMRTCSTKKKQIKTRGISQGGPISPLLSNIFLDTLDKELEERGHRFVRYADDCNIYVKSRNAGERVLRRTSNFLEENLKLRVNLNKSSVNRPWQRHLLGVTFTNEPLSKIVIPNKTIINFKDKVSNITDQGLTKEQELLKLKALLKGWLDYYYGLADNPSVLVEVEEWISIHCKTSLQSILAS